MCTICSLFQYNALRGAVIVRLMGISSNVEPQEGRRTQHTYTQLGCNESESHTVRRVVAYNIFSGPNPPLTQYVHISIRAQLQNTRSIALYTFNYRARSMATCLVICTKLVAFNYLGIDLCAVRAPANHAAWAALSIAIDRAIAVVCWRHRAL